MVQIPRSRGVNSVINTTPTLARKGRTGKSQAIGAVADTIVSASNVIETIRVNQETTMASNAYMKDALAIEQEANDNQDLSVEKQSEFKQRISDARTNASRMIKQPLARENFSLQAEGKGNILNSKVQGMFGAKLLDQDRGFMEENLDIYKENFIGAGNDKDRKAIMAEATGLLDAKALAGVIDREDASKRKLKIKEEWMKDDVSSDIVTHADGALEELNKGKKGIYPDLKDTDRQELIV